MIKWIIIVYLAVNIILALIPGLHELVQSAAGNMGEVGGVILRFLFDPTEYVWKWIIGLLVAVIALYSK